MSERALTADDASFKRLVVKVGLKRPAADARLPADYVERRFGVAHLPAEGGSR